MNQSLKASDKRIVQDLCRPVPPPGTDQRRVGKGMTMVAVDEELRREVGEALVRLALLEPGEVLDEATVTAAHRVLEHLEIRGGVDLQRDASCLRDELGMARGRSLAQVLAGPRPAAADLPAQRLA